VHGQTYPHWNLIVVDDCSSDGTVRVAREWAERDPRVKVLSSPANCGSSAARNLGLSHGVGRYVAFLDADDVWMAEKLERQLAFMSRRNAGFSFTAYQKFGSAGPGGVIGARPSVSWRDMLKGNRIRCSLSYWIPVFPRSGFLRDWEDGRIMRVVIAARGDTRAYGLVRQCHRVLDQRCTSSTQ
jgi:glycosyltransferase involved in cell wall biosynthesis